MAPGFLLAQFANFYNTRAWRRLSAWQRTQQPLCEMCLELGVVTEATEVDHVVPLSEDWGRRLDPTNLASICGECHGRVKQRQERTGKVIGNNAEGEPMDRNSAWWSR